MELTLTRTYQTDCTTGTCTVGAQSFFTIEQPWRDNANGASCVPLKQGAFLFISPIDSAVADPMSLRKIHEHDSLPVRVGDKNAPSGVTGLLGTASPSAISRLVIAIVVNSIYRVSRRWAATHVFQEVSEGHPTRTYLDSSASVPTVGVVRGIKASGFKATPRLVFRRNPIDSISMNEMDDAVHVSTQAAATARVSRPKFLCLDADTGPTVAMANPATMSSCASIPRGPDVYRNEPAKSLARNINPFHGCMLS